MRPAALAALAALAASTGCTSYTSSYQRSRAEAGELVWAYRDRFQVTQGGKVVAEQRDWNALTGLVACVPQAHTWAESAASRDHTGRLLSWSGIAVMLGGIAAGSALIFRDTSDTDGVLLGAGVLLGGVLVGAPISIGGIVMRGRADATAIDAVNLYNDERRACAR